MTNPLPPLDFLPPACLPTENHRFHHYHLQIPDPDGLLYDSDDERSDDPSDPNGLDAIVERLAAQPDNPSFYL